jgi:hypothetical protein
MKNHYLARHNFYLFLTQYCTVFVFLLHTLTNNHLWFVWFGREIVKREIGKREYEKRERGEK